MLFDILLDIYKHHPAIPKDGSRRFPLINVSLLCGINLPKLKPSRVVSLRFQVSNAVFEQLNYNLMKNSLKFIRNFSSLKFI